MAYSSLQFHRVGCNSMKKLVKNRRALSPVLSAVLMILVVITGMSLLFAFFVNYARDFQVGSGSAVLESMTVEDVWFRSPSTAEVWVYNFGKVDFKIASVYVNDNLANVDPSSLEVRVGEHGNLTVTYSFAAGNSYSFKIVTDRGYAFEGRYVWQ
jgi:flagellin-like protein